MALTGDTVRLSVKFLDINGEQVDPEDVYLNIYNEKDIAIDTIQLTEVDKSGIGEYFYDFTIPYVSGNYIVYEFAGTYRNKPILSRERINTRFV